MNRVEKIKSYLLHPFFPNHCIACGKVLDYDKNICPVCDAYIERFPKEKRCLSCGFEQKRCHCRHAVYRFSSVIAPFYNKGVAKCGFYRYKLANRQGNAQFFAEAMLKSVKEEYGNIKFDGVVCVPASKKRMSKFGYSPPEQLAHYIAKQLGIPFFKKALKHRNSSSKQHTLSRAERFAAVRGEYERKIPLNNKTVLLVDDIMTTGATLDECAKQLLLSGAEQVRCVTALITDRDAPYNKRYAGKLMREAGVLTDKKI